MSTERYPSLNESDEQVAIATSAANRNILAAFEGLLNAYLALFRALGSFTPTEDNKSKQVWL